MLHQFWAGLKRQSFKSVMNFQERFALAGIPYYLLDEAEDDRAVVAVAVPADILIARILFRNHFS